MRGYISVLSLLMLAAVLVPWARSNQRADIDEGRRLFAENCSACHGRAARGDGVVGRVLSTGVPNLTTLSARNQGDFPGEYVYDVIDGRRQIASHGSRLMPVWGHELWLREGADKEAELRAERQIRSLVAYLATIQEGP